MANFIRGQSHQGLANLIQSRPISTQPGQSCTIQVNHTPSRPITPHSSQSRPIKAKHVQSRSITPHPSQSQTFQANHDHSGLSRPLQAYQVHSRPITRIQTNHPQIQAKHPQIQAKHPQIQANLRKSWSILAILGPTLCSHLLMDLMTENFWVSMNDSNIVLIAIFTSSSVTYSLKSEELSLIFHLSSPNKEIEKSKCCHSLETREWWNRILTTYQSYHIINRSDH